MLKSPYKYAFCYDFETGGMNEQLNAITEFAFAIIDLDTLEIVEEYSALVKPYNKLYESGAEEATGITLDLLEKEGIPLEKLFSNFMEYIEEYTTEKCRPILAGHNIDGFDNSFLEVFLKTFSQRMDRTFNNNTTLDTLKLARLSWRQLENYQLATVCKEIGIELESAHRAENDVKANALLLIHFLKQMKN